MKISVPVIGSDARAYLNSQLDKNFQKPNGEDLDSVVLEVLKDRDVFTFLAHYSLRGQGLRLGQFSFFDDIRVIVDYGLVLDVDHVPRQTKLFTYETVNDIEQNNLELGLGFGDYKKKFSGDVREFPTPQRFVEEVNRTLLKPTSFLVKLNVETRRY